MKIEIADKKNLETHSFFIKLIRIFIVPLFNYTPGFLTKIIMRYMSSDAKGLLDSPGSSESIEVMYNGVRHDLFYKGFKQGIADFFWQRCLSNPKAMRNRLKIVEDVLRKEILQISKENNGSEINFLSVGGGATISIIETIDKLLKEEKNLKIKIIDVDKSPEAIEASKRLAKKFNLYDKFFWICDDVNNINNLLPESSIDICEMVGLLDYFSKEDSIKILTQVYNLLKNSAVFIVGNICPNNEKLLLSKIDWPKMHYRKPEELSFILENAGFSLDKTNFIIEPLKIHTIAVIRK